MNGLHKGFTFFEILLVLIISGTITALGLVSLARLQSLFKLRSSADQIKSQLQYGRELAMANKDRKIYHYLLSGNTFTLKADTAEISRNMIPSGVTISPASFSWDFTSISGTIPACSPCQITLTSGGLTETVVIQANGIIN